MFTCGSRVDNVHGWATLGQLFTGGAHVEEGIPLELINQSESALQKYMVNVWIHVKNVGPNHTFTHIVRMSPCDHMAFVRDYHLVTCFFQTCLPRYMLLFLS